jgi:hypothetical protein
MEEALCALAVRLSMLTFWFDCNSLTVTEPEPKPLLLEFVFSAAFMVTSTINQLIRQGYCHAGWAHVWLYSQPG